MERQAVVKTAAHQRLDPLDMVRREVGTQHDLDRAAARQLDEQLVGLDWRRPRAAPRCSASAGRPAPALAAISANATNGSANKALANIFLPEIVRAPSAAAPLTLA